MSCKLDPAIWSRGIGQRIACFDRCQLIIAGMSNIKDVHGKPRLYVSFLEYGRHVGQLRRRRRAYAPTSNTASQDNHAKINSCVSFIFPLHDEYGAPLGGLSGRRSSAINIFHTCSVGTITSCQTIEREYWTISHKVLNRSKQNCSESMFYHKSLEIAKRCKQFCDCLKPY